MEGDTSELEIDSELVMSFYDQYQVDDLACKVYCGVEPVKSEPGGGLTLSTSVIELKPPVNNLAPAPDVSMMCPASPCSSAGPPGTSTAWNLPDLLVGLDGIQTRCSSDTDSPPLSSQNLLTSTIPCISIPSLDITDHPSSTNQFYTFDSYRGPGQTDSLLEGLGILSPPPVTSVKTEMVSCSSPQPQYSLVDTRGESPISMDLSQLVTQHNIPAQFELSLSPKCEPGLLAPANTNSIPISSFSLSNITNIASVSIANIDLLSKSAPLSLDLIAQHCTLLPPELVSLPQGPNTILDTNTTTYIAQDQDIINNNINTDMESVLQPVNIKEEEECLSPKLAGEVSSLDNPSYKRCHMCVRIFSTKANLSSHIRHVHMGEAKHSRVKSIPCPHCNKMFSRKGHMTEHVRTVHEGKKRIYKEVNCQHCGKTFRRKWGLNIHISSAHADVVSSLLKQ